MRERSAVPCDLVSASRGGVGFAFVFASSALEPFPGRNLKVWIDRFDAVLILPRGLSVSPRSSLSGSR